MLSKLLNIAAPVALALLASAAFGAESDDQQVPPQVGDHTTCLQGYGTLECISIPVAPDPEDCLPGQRLIAVRGYGYLRHVCVPNK